jgi:hypothetical protein
MILHRDLRDLAFGRPMPPEEGARDEAGQRGHRRAIRPLVGVDGTADELGHARRGQVGHLLAAHDEDRSMKTGRDLREPRVEGGRARRGRCLDAHRGHLREPHVGGNVGGKIAVPEKFLGVHGGDDHGIGSLDAGGEQRGVRGLGHQIL